MVGKARDLSHELDRRPHGREIAGVASSSAKATAVPQPDNDELANLLERIADLLDTQRGNLYRVRAYRNAARTIRTAESLAPILREEGKAGIEKLPGIGKSIAALLDEYAHSGRSALLDRLEGQVSPEDLFATVPGIGEALAQRIHQKLGIETLEELEVAAHTGRLETVEGVGPRRVSGIRDAVAGILSRSTRRRARHRRWLEADINHAGLEEHAHIRPNVATILAVDSQYLRQARAGQLQLIRPRRFNPEGRSWLPVLHTERDGWTFTALFSNTARAHELGTTHDWVILYHERNGDEDQYTVVTERRGPLSGRRVVRGREGECTEYYLARGSE
jgi:hypothetical protein